ncbi:hypothetical protein MATL_G00117910 [Megalops atlanticus]|uniref:Uncharacterized protein n=1 Tax=Megalops atlanticus TaxID=7932 RepID=A0A9D3PZ70_MEGAT|nr:hypothetical protein MATL_G00117910 [Megalops atlanticus]
MDESGDSPFSSSPTVSPSFMSRVGPIGIGVAVGLGVIIIILIACLLRRLFKCKCCKRKKPSMTEKVLKKVGLQKPSRPFSVSGILDKK